MSFFYFYCLITATPKSETITVPNLPDINLDDVCIDVLVSDTSLSRWGSRKVEENRAADELSEEVQVVLHRVLFVLLHSLCSSLRSMLKSDVFKFKRTKYDFY